MKAKIKYLAVAPVAIAILFLSFAGIGHAQGRQPIVAEVDRAQLSTDQVLNLSVTVSAPSMSVPRPAIPALQGFNVVGSSSSTSISLVNGAVSSQVVYSYRLQPYETGELVIGPINVTLGGQAFSTQPITVQVSQGTGAPASSIPPSRQQAVTSTEFNGQDLFVEAQVDHSAPYVGQQVVYTFRLYQAVNFFGQPQYEAPSFTGFWSEATEDQDTYRVQAAGRIYQVTELRTVLYPTLVGPVTIDPARLTTPGSLLRSGTTLQTGLVELDVQPLPPTAPAGFDGAVGQYTLTGAVDSREGAVNEPLTWRVTLNGWGNITAAPDPTWPEMRGWRSFESEATVNTQVTDGQAGGSRFYERLLVPSVDGPFTIPALEYVYFDPIGGEYRVATTEPIEVSIAPGATGMASIPPTGVDKQAVEQVASDIRHLKPVPDHLDVAEQPVTEQGLYWIAWGFPIMGAAGYFVWQRRQRYLEDNQGVARSSRARKRAKKALAQARKTGDVYDVAGQILTTYLADKLNRPVAGLTHQALAELLAGQGVGAELIERVELCLVSSELGRFAPEANSPDYASSLLQEVDRLTRSLEKVL